MKELIRNYDVMQPQKPVSKFRKSIVCKNDVNTDINNLNLEIVEEEGEDNDESKQECLGMGSRALDSSTETVPNLGNGLQLPFLAAVSINSQFEDEDIIFVQQETPTDTENELID